MLHALSQSRAGAAPGSLDTGYLGSSSNTSGVDPTLGRTSTKTTHGNLSITRAVIGDNYGTVGDIVTYRTTIPAVTVALTTDRVIVGSWPVDATTGATVVYESTHRFTSETPGMVQNGWDANPNSLHTGVAIDVTDLGTVVGPSGIEVRCVGGTSIPSTDENIFDVIDGFFEGS